MRLMIQQRKVKKEDSNFHGRNDELSIMLCIMSELVWIAPNAMEALLKAFPGKHNYYM